MKKLPASLREDTRYFRFKVHSEQDAELGDVVDAVWDSALDYLGTSGASEADFWIIGNKFSETDQEGVIRVNHETEAELRAAMCLVGRIGGEPGFLEITSVSGNIKKL